MNIKFSRFGRLLLLALALAVPSLVWRIGVERDFRSALVLFDLGELGALKAPSPERTFQTLMEAGVSAFIAPEFTGGELRLGALKNVVLVPAEEVPETIAVRFSAPNGTAVVLRKSESLPQQMEYLRARFGGGEVVESGTAAYYRIPLSLAQLEECGVLPDLSSMSYLSHIGAPLVFAPAPGDAAGLMRALELVSAQFPSVKGVCPIGEVAAGYPDPKPLGEFVRGHGLLMAQVEFSRQYGSGHQVSAAWPNIVSLHAVRREEVLKRGIGRSVMLNRLFRAAQEREVRLLVLRLDPLRSSPQTLEEYCADALALRSRLDQGGFSRLWPAPAPRPHGVWPILSAAGLSLLVTLLAVRFCERFGVSARHSGGRRTLLLVFGAVALCGLSCISGLCLRLVGAAAATLLATEAALTAMDGWRAPLPGAVAAFLLTCAGGLTIAGCFSTPMYMYRLSTFSGVKLSLLLPPVLILLADLKRREHPESLAEILSRPPLWGELALVGVLLLGALLMLLRSGNYGFVSAGEINARDWVEGILGARPRTKEFLLGYPALVCWYYLKRMDLWRHWREALRIAVALAYTSAVNSFCHFHTPLAQTLLRGFNGWWTGLLLGCLILSVAVFLGRPLYRRARGLFF